MDTIEGMVIGGCRVEREIGRGGMGVVYLARDERLDRPVAVKALPESVARDEARSARLAREAKSLASLTHANIAAIYGLTEQDGRLFMLLEYVDGPTLGDRVAAGPLAVDEAVSVCAQIAAGVEAAHEAGIIHRDLKPHNVKVMADGKVKVLDFGLARPAVREASAEAVTVKVAGPAPTAEGVVMGTPAYMSPEQARGRAVDRRTDIWALGCILYECLTGGSPFGGPTDSDSIAAVLEREPDWSKLPARTPYRVRELLRRCLQKEQGARLRDIGDARLELETALAGREWTSTAIAAAGGQGSGRRAKRAVLMGGSVVVLLGAGWAMGRWWPRAEPAHGGADKAAGEPPLISRLTLPVAGAMKASERFALSPDGRMLAVIGVPTTGDSDRSQVYVRRMDTLVPTLVPGTAGAYDLSFSPDGKWLAVIMAPGDGSARSVLMKTQVAGGPLITLVEQADGRMRQCAWVGQDAVAFAWGTRISTVPAEGGTPKPVWDGAAAGQRPVAMCAAPGGRWLLVTTPISDEAGPRQAVLRVALDGGEAKLLQDNAAYAQAGPGGVVLYAQAAVMMARPFDAAKGEFSGVAVPVVAGLRTARPETTALWSVSDRGDLVYAQGGRGMLSRRLALVDFQGRADAMGKTVGEFEGAAAFSPDGSRVCGTALTEAGAREPFLCAARQDAVRRLSVPGSDVSAPVWSADGHRLYFAAMARGAPSRIMSRQAEGLPEPDQVIREKGVNTTVTPESATKDGNWLICRQEDRRARTCRLVAVGLDGAHTTRTLVEKPGRQDWGSVSPDGKWLLYESDESGRPEVYVQPNPLAEDPAQDARVQISRRGGAKPAWSRDGATVFFFEGRDTVMAVDWPAGAAAGRELFHWEPLDAASENLVPSPDGKHFLIVQRTDEETRIRQLQYVQNWGQELKVRLVEGDKPR